MTDENKKNSSKKDIVFVVFIILLVAIVSLFNFAVDPYAIFRQDTIKSFNNLKIHKLSSRRTVLLSDIKLNSKDKTIAFTGNCMLTNYWLDLPKVAFFTVPVARMSEIYKLVKDINVIAPNVKTIYWGIYFDDILNLDSENYSDTLPDLDSKNFNLHDFINLFFSWNTTKYSIETVLNSMKYKGEEALFIYPYREIARKEYTNIPPKEHFDDIRQIVEFAKKQGINFIAYYSPVHVSKKVHIYQKGKWENFQNIKRMIADIIPFYDYSLFNDYNYQPLDSKNLYFIDNVHPSILYNNLILEDLLKGKKSIPTYIDKANIENYLEKDTLELENYIKNNPDIVSDITKVTANDYNYKILKDNK